MVFFFFFLVGLQCWVTVYIAAQTMLEYFHGYCCKSGGGGGGGGI